MTESSRPIQILDEDEPLAFTRVPGAEESPFFLACDHASNRIPRSLGTMGLADPHRLSHIAWDIGIAEVARAMAARLGAELVLSNYSRLVIDCNRPLSAKDSITSISADVPIPANVGLSHAEVAARVEGVFRPYHGCIESALDRRLRDGQTSIYVALHSFTPVMRGFVRPWHVGVLYQRDARIAKRLLESLGADPTVAVGDNEPYRVSDATDYSVVTYGEGRELLHVELELRQDLITNVAGQSEWAERLARLLVDSATKELGRRQCFVAD